MSLKKNWCKFFGQCKIRKATCRRVKGIICVEKWSKFKNERVDFGLFLFFNLVKKYWQIELLAESLNKKIQETLYKYKCLAIKD